MRQVDKDPELAAAVGANDMIIHTGLTELVRRGAAAGSVDPELEPEAAAAWIQAVIDGAYLHADARTDPRPYLRRTVVRFLAPPPTEARARTP